MTLGSPLCPACLGGINQKFTPYEWPQTRMESGKMAEKTPEQIAASAVRHGHYLARQGIEPGFGAFVDEIKAYGDQRAAEARANLTIPPKPTTLERVAMGIAASHGWVWGNISDSGANSRAHFRKGAIAALTALRMAPNRSAYGGAWHLPGELLNAYLDSILAEKQP